MGGNSVLHAVSAAGRDCGSVGCPYVCVKDKESECVDHRHACRVESVELPYIGNSASRSMLWCEAYDIT